jgi:predicted porin
MKKSLIALAVLGTSFAASAQVTLSGRAAMEVGNWQATGATATADKSSDALSFRDRTRVADVGSRIILRVNEDLGGGLRAFAMCETGINIDNGSSTGQANTNNGNTTTWCSREGHLGIGNRTAEVRLGRQNVWWTQGPVNVTGAVYHSGDAVTDLLTGGVGQYTVRGENMIMLVAGPGTGAWAGSNVYMGYMGASGHINSIPGATGTIAQFSGGQDNGESAGAGKSATGKYQGLKVAYSQGALVGSFDMQTSDTGNTAYTTTAQPGVAGDRLERSAWKLGAGYRYSGAKSPNIVSLQYVVRDRTATTAAGAATKGEENVLMLVGQYALAGGWIVNATYGKASDRKDNNVTAANTGATAWGLGVVKTLSNRTHAMFQYRTIDNKAAAAYGFNGGNYASGAAAAGADSKAFGVGLVHNF